MSGPGEGSEAGMLVFKGVSGEVFVGALLTISVRNWGTLEGWMLWMSLKAGRRRRVVGSE